MAIFEGQVGHFEKLTWGFLALGPAEFKNFLAVVVTGYHEASVKISSQYLNPFSFYRLRSILGNFPYSQT